MRKLRSLICFTAILISSSFSLAQGINQLDGNGKRDGKWIVYLDQNWKRTDDKSIASCYRYTFYDHGVNIYPMGPCGKKGYRLQAPAAQSGDVPLLDGEYTWYDEKGQLSSVHVFSEGVYVSCKEYFSSGELSQYFDYAKKSKDQEHSWIAYGYRKNGELKFTSPVCKDKDGRWPVMRD